MFGQLTTMLVTKNPLDVYQRSSVGITKKAACGDHKELGVHQVQGISLNQVWDDILLDISIWDHAHMHRES